jgi:hypothetical protein
MVTTETTPTPTFLQWSPDESGHLHLVREPLIRCPQCGDFCGFLYRDEDTPEGACLSCKLDAELIADYERTEQDAFWAETCCTCGID